MFQFDGQSVSRIADVVRGVEQMGFVDPTGQRKKVLPGSLIRLGKTTVAHDKGNTETVDLYDGTSKGSESDTGRTIEVYNRFGDIETGKWVLCVFILGGWELIAAEC